MKSRSIPFFVYVLLTIALQAIDNGNSGMQLAAKIRDDYLAVGDLDDRWYVELCPVGESDTYLAVDSYSMYRDGAEWAFYRKSAGHWQEWNGLLYVRNDFYRWMEDGRNRTIIYSPSFAPVDVCGNIRTWDEYNEATNHFQVRLVEDTFRYITIDMDGSPRIFTNEDGFVSHLWTDSFRSLEKMNLDIYSGTNLTHSKLFPASTAPEAPMLGLEEKAAFASWFRSCAATNGIPATNAVLAVFADDDFDGRMDAFASLDTPPDADGARDWAFCWNTGDGWAYFGPDTSSSVAARTNEFFHVRLNGNDNGNTLTHGIIVIRPNPESPVHPLLPRNSAAPLPTPANWSSPIHPPRRFITNYDEFFDLYEYLFFRLERLPADTIPCP